MEACQSCLELNEGVSRLPRTERRCVKVCLELRECVSRLPRNAWRCVKAVFNSMEVCQGCLELHVEVCQDCLELHEGVSRLPSTA